MRSCSLAEHAGTVADICTALKAAAGAPVHVDKGGVHHVVPIPGDKRHRSGRVDISALSRVVRIDAEARTCVAEPGVTFAELVAETLPLGLMPAVVPELEGITVGGAVAGCSLESLSYIYGGFHDTCVEYEVISGTGEVITLSREERPDLFEMVHGSYGTLGIVSLVTFRLIPALPFVRMEYRHCGTFAEFEAALRAATTATAAGADPGVMPVFVDAIVFGPDHLVLCLGHMVDSAPYVSDYRRDGIYYRSVAERAQDYLGTTDYLFRYDTECHWLSRTVPPLEWRPVRRLLGRWFLGSTNLIRWSRRLDRILGMRRRPDVVCDVFVPGARFAEFFDWYEAVFDFWPLWVVPYRMPQPYRWIDPDHATGLASGLAIDCAVYGKRNNRRDVDYSALLESETHRLGGIKTLIGRNHYSREDFWRIYNRDAYDAAKSELDPDAAFDDLYDKFVNDHPAT